ncbi:MAG: hypothetical protein JWP87_3295 [Labilithrix sp.]|nr:hypothetical protein [Labilithrix sp.]
MDDLVLRVREERAPLWATLAPALYLFACALCVRSVLMDRSIDIGIAGLLVAVGLAPAFALPAIFSTRNARLGASNEGLLVDGALVKIDAIRIDRADRGMARLVVETRAGTTRTFIAPSYKDAQKLMSLLPPVSAPAGALAA